MRLETISAVLSVTLLLLPTHAHAVLSFNPDPGAGGIVSWTSPDGRLHEYQRQIFHGGAGDILTLDVLRGFAASTSRGGNLGHVVAIESAAEYAFLTSTHLLAGFLAARGDGLGSYTWTDGEGAGQPVTLYGSYGSIGTRPECGTANSTLVLGNLFWNGSPAQFPFTGPDIAGCIDTQTFMLEWEAPLPTAIPPTTWGRLKTMYR